MAGDIFCSRCGTKLGSEPQKLSTGRTIPRLEDIQDQLHVPELLRRKMDAAALGMRGENRLVTAMFADISGFTQMSQDLTPEATVEAINQCFRVIAETVHSCEGSINRFIGDCVLAFFGAPLAHENDPERAVLAALEMRRSVSQLELGISIGINTGMAYFGPIGTPGQHMEISAYGHEINLAKRLQESAQPGQILVGEGTYHLAHREFEFMPVGSIQVKGVEKPIPAYEVLRLLPQPIEDLKCFRGLMIGRDREFAQFRGCIDNLVAGKGQIVLIDGEAGIGKSRLVAEVRDLMVDRNLLWLEGRSLSFSQTLSYWPFLEILRTYAGIGEQDTMDEVYASLERSLRELFPEHAAEILPYLTMLLGLEARGELQERVKYLDAETLRAQIFRASRRFFERLAQDRPVVLVFEDLHWADQSSVELLEHLLPLVRHASLLICGVVRTELEGVTARLREAIHQNYGNCYTEISLVPLNPADNRKLLCNLLQSEYLPPMVHDLILRKTEGNPLFIEELIRALVDTGALARDKATGGWYITPKVEQITIPDTLWGVIMARVDRLDEEVKEVLRIAAVIGRSFFYKVLKAVEEETESLDDRLDELQRLELIRRKALTPELEFIFKHALTQEATYKSILSQRRRRLHHQVAESIELLFAGRLDDFYGPLAYHYTRSEDWDRAHNYLLKLGDQAGRVAADAEALLHYQKAMETYDRMAGKRWEPLQRARLERKVGEALFRQGKHQQALDQLQQALDYLDSRLPSSRWGIRLAIIRQIIQQMGHRLLPALFLRGENPDPVTKEVCRIYEVMAWMDYFADQERFLLEALTGLNTAEHLCDNTLIPLGLMAIGVICNYIPIHWLAYIYHKRAVGVAEKTGTPIVLGHAYHGMAIHEDYVGNWELAMELYQWATDNYWIAGSLRRWGSASMMKARLHCTRGEFAANQELSRRVAQIGEEGSDSQLLAWGLNGQGIALMHTGLLDEAEASLKQACDLLMAVPDYYIGALAKSDLGIFYMRQGNLEEGMNLLEESHRLIEEYRLRGHIVTLCHNAYAETYLLSAEHSEGARREDLLRKAKHACYRALRGCGTYRGSLAYAYRLRGTYECLTGKHTAAQKWWQRGLIVAEKQGTRYDLGMTHLEMGRKLRDASHLKRSEEIFLDIGAELELSQVQNLLE